MKFEKLGKEMENVTIEIGPFDFGESNIIKNLHNTISCIREKKPNILGAYTKTLTKKLQKIAASDYFNDDSGRLKKHIKEYDFLNEHIDLLKLMLGYFTKILNVTEEQFWLNEKQAFPEWNFFHSVRDIHLLNIKSLIEVLGKDETIEFYKEIVVSYIARYDQNQKDSYKDLDDLRQHHSKFIKNNTLGRVRLVSEVKNGKYIEICLTCDKVRSYPDASQEDKELLDVTGCYCHLPLAKLWNKNFELTLNNTIAKGDPFCTYVYHDTRIVNEIEDPPKEFFDRVVAKYK